ncbi:YcxB family protein [Brucepastera parasyntrophica]|uniref:YcxB family protein n=1 Tax=Brucepastera parasyntrophica TaxID=2880008 RepID=UPI00210C9D1D|nr:YcxB family protein [Brucepastera parasyntrophica]ULQ58626.1 YcxB family protein [Brucepastera parasyntrophica]
MKEFTFSGKISFDDYVQMNRFYMKEHILRQKVLLIVLIVCAAVIVGFSIYGSIVYKETSLFEDLLPLLIIVVVIFLVIRRPKILYKKYYYSSKMLQEERTFIINETAIIQKTESSDVKLTKNEINRIRFDKDSIYIFTGENSVFIIKEAYFENRQEYNELKEFIRKNFM